MRLTAIYCSPSSSVDRTQTSVISGLGKKLKGMMNNFQRLKAKMTARYKEIVEHRLSSLAQPCSSLCTSMDDKIRALTTQSSSLKPIGAGICVLAVDDDVTCLKIVEVMLRAFQYEVVTVKHASDALAILRAKQGGFDIVLTDLHMPEMDGLALLKRVDVEFKIPVVMMSADEKEIVASRCLESGASFYLTKPLTKSDLGNLWQHVYLKKRTEPMVIEKIGSDSESPTSLEKVSKEDSSDESASSLNESNWRQASRKQSSTKKYKNKRGNKYGNAAKKKSRVVWNHDLHTKFLDAIDEIGLHLAVPKKIVELMNVPGLTRNNVASHLQKYRIFLRRIDEATRSSDQPSMIRSLMMNGAVKSSFALGQPCLLHKMKRGFSGKSFEPRQGSCSNSQQRNETCKPRRNQRKLKQPDTISLTNQRNDGNHTSFQMDPPNIRTRSSSQNGTLETSLATSTDTLPMVHWNFARGSIDGQTLPSNNIQNVGSILSFNNVTYNQVPNLNCNNDGFAGIQMNSMGNKYGFSQNSIGEGPSSRMDEIRDGKMHAIDTGKSPINNPGFTSFPCDYAAQGFASSGGFMPQALAYSSRFASTNPFSSILTNVSQEPPLMPLPPPPQQQPQQQNEFRVGEDQLMEHNSAFGNVSSPVSFVDDYINEILREQVDTNTVI
ncbi:hypothetical protein NE237_027955 [Protea cynaroides]|uniref:Two-component response regulator n=1 Tax=Protea cynaroides TaxID=273540 RepID=A0A9Q0JUU8_9MAGN|nr:hypothetical protein NE237_027955 [Protea cynaroides]